MRVQNLNIGIEQVSRWRVQDESHLPTGKKLAPTFLPRAQPLDKILRRPSFDERLINLLEPEGMDPDLLTPPVFKAARLDVVAFFEEKLAQSRVAYEGEEEWDQDYFETVQIFKRAEQLDADVTEALASLIKG